MQGIKETVAEHRQVAGRPRYDVAVKKIIDRIEKPMEPPVGQFDIGPESSPGVRRLNEVMRYIAYIPTQLVELRNRPLDVKQMEIAMLTVKTCLPKIVGVDEWAADRNKFLKMMLEYEGTYTKILWRL